MGLEEAFDLVIWNILGNCRSFRSKSDKVTGMDEHHRQGIIIRDDRSQLFKTLDTKNNVHTTNGKDMKINNEWTPMKAQDDIGA